VTYVHRPYLDPMAARVLQDLVRGIEAHRLAVDQAGGKRRRFVAFEPATGIGDQCEAGGMALGKTVTAKALDLVEELLGIVETVAAFEHALRQLFPVRLQPAAAFPCRHRTTQRIGLARG